MKVRILLFAFISIIGFMANGQQKPAWDDWTPLIGTWEGEGSGEPGQGGGTFTFSYNSQVNTKFEMSQDGVNFMTYIEGISSKKQSSRIYYNHFNMSRIYIEIIHGKHRQRQNQEDHQNQEAGAWLLYEKVGGLPGFC